MPNPFLVGVTELRRRSGTQRAIELHVELSGLALSSARVPEGAEIDVELTLESMLEGITATGTVTVPWEAECRRCLVAIHGEATAEVREVFEAHPVEGETYPLEGDHIDLEPLVREAALLALPLAPLCREDCEGPAPEVFPTRPETGPGSGEEPAERPADPRWAALDELRFDDDA